MITCLKCKVLTNNVQCYNILMFPLKEVRKFKKKKWYGWYNRMFYFEKDDYMNGENQIYCNSCKRMANNINKSKILIDPNVLVINLNRG